MGQVRLLKRTDALVSANRSMATAFFAFDQAREACWVTTQTKISSRSALIATNSTQTEVIKGCELKPLQVIWIH